MSHATASDATRPLLSVAQAAELAAVNRKTIYREIERGELRALHVGRVLRIDPAEFAAYLERGGDW